MAIVLGTLASDELKGTRGADLITALTGNDTIVAGSGADVIDAGSGDDVIYTASRNAWSDGAVDTVLAGLGDDHVYAAYGDALDGGLGFDTLSLDLSGQSSGVSVDFRPMTIGILDIGLGDLLRVSITLGGAVLDAFEAVDHVIGTDFADTIITDNRGNVASNLEGGAGDDTLQTGAGDDRLDGGTGADHMSGGRGDDTYVIDNLGDVVTEATNGGNDRAIVSIDNYQLGANIETVVLAGNVTTVRGNAENNTLTGNAGNNTLYGLDGRDTIDGGAGNDTIYGGKSRDMLTGGDGRDTFVFLDGEAEDAGAPRKLADFVTDFSHAQGDRLSVRGVDAIAGGGDDRFAFIGSDRFSGEAGELRFAHINGDTFVFGDTDGDKVDDFRIQLNGTIDLVAADFVL